MQGLYHCTTKSGMLLARECIALYSRLLLSIVTEITRHLDLTLTIILLK